MEVNPDPATLETDPERVATATRGKPQSRHTKTTLWNNSRELGLALGLVAGKHLLNTSHLHYGIWAPDIPVKAANFGKAQQRFAEFILKHIPANVSSILDVGCGAGALASQLLGRGHSVDCVCPNPVLARAARKHLKDRAQVFECAFEALETHRRYDLFLFSESFQYIRMHKCLEKILQLSQPGSLVMICDFFKTDAPGECVIGGGHNLREFYELVARYRCWEKVKDIDITARTAPTMDVVNEALRPAAAIWKGLRWLSGGPRSPVLSAFGKDFSARVDQLERKYFSGQRTAQHFATFKSYRLIILWRTY